MTVGDFPLNGKVAVVTGGGSGISLAFAKLAVQHGARVIIADLKLTTDGEEFLKVSGPKSVLFSICDVTKRSDLEHLVKLSKGEFGDVPDIYVAGAGIFEPASSNFWDDAEEDGYASVDININHPIKLSRIAIRSFLRNEKKGVVLILSSLAGYQGLFAAPIYSATKHALVGFVRSMAPLDELENVKIVAIAPGFVLTPLLTEVPHKMQQWSIRKETCMSAEYVASMMVDLVTEKEYGGGTCLEATLEGKRVLGTWNIDPPKATGSKIPQGAIDANFAPVIALLKNERSAA